MTTKAFRPGDIIFTDPSCYECRAKLVEEDSMGRNMLYFAFVLHILIKINDAEFGNLVADSVCLWLAFAFRWRGEQDVADLDAIRTRLSVSAPSPSNIRIRNLEYFIRQGWEILFHCKRQEEAGEMGVAETARVWERLVVVRRVWGIPLLASTDEEELRVHVSCICEVFFCNKMSIMDFKGNSTDHALSVLAGVGLNHSCWPNSHVRFVDTDDGAVVEDEVVHQSKLIVYAIEDIPIGEEVTIAYVDDPFWNMSQLKRLLQVEGGFQCRDCPRCRDPSRSPMPLDRRSCKLGLSGIRHLGELTSLEAIMMADMELAKTGHGHFSGLLHSMSECFGMTVRMLQPWISKGEIILPPLNKELRDARAHLAFCFYARQQYAEAMALYEALENVERIGYTYYSPRRITNLQYLVKLLALQGQGGTVRFQALVEEVTHLKRVNYGNGRENEVEDPTT